MHFKGISDFAPEDRWTVCFGEPGKYDVEFISGLPYDPAIEIVQRWNYYIVALARMPQKDMEFDIRIRQDGNAFCASFHDFVDPQVSPVGFGSTPYQAIDDIATEDGPVSEYTDITPAVRMCMSMEDWEKKPTPEKPIGEPNE